jgi:signal transduction histidine kinase
MPGTERSLKGSSMRAGFLLAFVILSLVALVVTPMLIQRRVDTLRDVVENVGEPARTMVTQVQFALAREMSSLWGYLLTGDAEFLDQFAASLAQERTTYAQLEQHVPRLGPAVLERYVELRSLERRWRDQIAWAELTRDGAGEEGALLTEPELFETVLRAATELDRAIVQEMVGYREAVRSVERMSLLISAFLGTLAFLSALASGWLGRRIRVLAHEAEVRTEVSEQALLETRKAIAERNRLLRGITHDVKNPLGAADAYAQLLLEVGSTSLSPKEQGWVIRMRRSIHAALGIINELLDLSRVESGEIVIERRPLDLAEVVQEAVEDHEGLARAAGHRMAVRLTDVPEHVYSDPNHLRRILDNLISNAIKHGGRHGYITVRVDSPPPGSVPKVGEWVRVRVSDTGQGIPADEREAIFTEFHRLAGTTADGHGLGLAISRRIARALGGDITVESVVGRGATFTLWVPIRAATDFHSPEIPSWAVRNS